MSNRNFDASVIIQRLQQKTYAKNTYTSQQAGQTILRNPQNSNGNASVMTQYAAGSQGIVQKGLLGGVVCTEQGGTCIPPSS